MLSYIENLPENVLGIKATGEVSVEDYKKVLIPHLDMMSKQKTDINYLLVLETDIGNFTAAAWWKDFTLAFEHFTQWKKVAIVTDQKGVEWFADISRFLIPGKVKGFSLDELEKAKQWISSVDDSGHKSGNLNIPNDNDELEPELENSSNKGQGPAGENL
ncbi:MAG TPA: STAS/SEC14 domain-containing protein [Mucilaginibacter sp.]|nr:STAS/SEC14 domain-containing protein [Mucilaginibacter sp.]